MGRAAAPGALGVVGAEVRRAGHAGDRRTGAGAVASRRDFGDSGRTAGGRALLFGSRIVAGQRVAAVADAGARAGARTSRARGAAYRAADRHALPERSRLATRLTLPGADRLTANAVHAVPELTVGSDVAGRTVREQRRRDVERGIDGRHVGGRIRPIRPAITVVIGRPSGRSAPPSVDIPAAPPPPMWPPMLAVVLPPLPTITAVPSARRTAPRGNWCTRRAAPRPRATRRRQTTWNWDLDERTAIDTRGPRWKGRCLVFGSAREQLLRHAKRLAARSTPETAPLDTPLPPHPNDSNRPSTHAPPKKSRDRTDRRSLCQRRRWPEFGPARGRRRGRSISGRSRSGRRVRRLRSNRPRTRACEIPTQASGPHLSFARCVRFARHCKRRHQSRVSISLAFCNFLRARPARGKSG